MLCFCCRKCGLKSCKTAAQRTRNACTRNSPHCAALKFARTSRARCSPLSLPRPRLAPRYRRFGPRPHPGHWGTPSPCPGRERAASSGGSVGPRIDRRAMKPHRTGTMGWTCSCSCLTIRTSGALGHLRPSHHSFTRPLRKEMKRWGTRGEFLLSSKRSTM